MTKTNITDEEKELLKAHAKTSPLTVLRLKSQATRMASIFTENESNANSAKLLSEDKLYLKEVLASPPSEDDYSLAI